MKQLIDHRILAACFTGCLLLALPGCERALEVVDQLDDGAPGPPGTGTPTTPPDSPVQNAACACASSVGLRALICGGGEVPLVDNDIVQTTTDGSAAAFTRCDPETFDCSVMLWKGGAAEVVSEGRLLGLDGTGERLLVINGLVNVVDVGGEITALPMSMLQGSQLLSVDGEVAFGSLPWPYEERGERIGRRHATGEIEVLGDVRGSIARSYGNPTGTSLVGWTIGEQGEGDDLTVVYEAFRWDVDGGLRFDFPGVPEGVTLWPETASDDGTIIAGRSVPDQAHFIWSEAGGYTELAPASWASETFISADGSAVLGSIDPGGLTGTRAFRWTAATGVVELTPGTPSVALDISDDGAVAVAYSWEEAQIEGAAPEATFVWDIEHGTRTLDEVLAQRGIDTSGWELGTPRALSGDGRVLLGLASCGGVETLYRAELSD
jgi:hypothetical protein